MSNIFHILKNFQKFLIITLTLIFLILLFSGNTFAAGEKVDISTGGYDYGPSATESGPYNLNNNPGAYDGTTSSATGNSGNTSTENTIHIREPFFEGENEIDVSVQKGSINILSAYVSGIFRFVAALSVIIAVLVLMAAGFKIMVAGGDTSARDDAKEWMGKVFMGLAFLFLSGLFLKTINPNFYVFGGGTQSSEVRDDIDTGKTETEKSIEAAAKDGLF